MLRRQLDFLYFVTLVGRVAVCPGCKKWKQLLATLPFLLLPLSILQYCNGGHRVVYLVCVVKISRQINFISTNAHHVKTKTRKRHSRVWTAICGYQYVLAAVCNNTMYPDHPVFFTFTYFTQQCDWGEIGKKLLELWVAFLKCILPNRNRIGPCTSDRNPDFEIYFLDWSDGEIVTVWMWKCGIQNMISIFSQK